MKIIEKIRNTVKELDVSKIKEKLPFIQQNHLKSEGHPLLKELRTVQDELQKTRCQFDLLSNRDLIESCIYQIESLEVKYNYLIKQARKQGLIHSVYCPSSSQTEEGPVPPHPQFGQTSPGLV